MMRSVRLLVGGVILLSFLGASSCASESGEQVQTQLTQAQVEKEELAAQLVNAKSNLTTLEASVTSLTSEVADLEAHLAEEQANTTKLTALISRQRDDLGTEKDEADRLRAEVQQVEAARAELAQEAKRLEAEVASLRRADRPVPTATPAPETATGITFTTYEDKEKGFSIDYPQGWTILTGKDLPSFAAEGLEMMAFPSDIVNGFASSYVEGPFLSVNRYLTTELGFATVTLEQAADFTRIGILMMYPDANQLSSGQMLTTQGLEGYYFLFSFQEGTDHFTQKRVVYVDDNTIVYELAVASISTKYNEFATLFTRFLDSFSMGPSVVQ